MKRGFIEQIADAVLYEGYLLYPYRPSALKNRQRWNFGGLCPPAYAEAHRGSEMSYSQAQCLVLGGSHTAINVKVRFLQPLNRQAARVQGPVTDVCELSESELDFVEALDVEGRLLQSWQEATECEMELPLLLLDKSLLQPVILHFRLPGSRTAEPLRDSQGKIVAAVIRTQHAIEACAWLDAKLITGSLFELTLQVRNLTPLANASMASRDTALMRSLVSNHAIFEVAGGEFISLLDPPGQFLNAAEKCQNVGTYPVLVGEEGSRSAMLSSPVILYDYPRIAPESAGDLFDGTEIDEILTLRILALTDQEKSAMRQCDPRARQILERIEAHPEHLARLHGTLRSPSLRFDEPSERVPINSSNPFERKPELDAVCVSGVNLRVGDRVRLRPQKSADIFDLALAGQFAVIESIEQDFDERIHLAVLVDGDPGRDLGELRLPGHRFFFSPEEVELVDQSIGTNTPRATP